MHLRFFQSRVYGQAVASIFILSIFSICVRAQMSHQIFEHLTTDQGLSSNKVEAILQDKEGFFWIATQNGLNRYDGSTFKTFRHNAEDTTSLTHNHCTALVEGRDGDIWISTYKGLSRYARSSACFEQIFLSHPSQNFELANRIYNLAVDNEGNIWIAGSGVWKYDTHTHQVTLFQPEKDNPASISRHSLVTHIINDSLHNGIWLASGYDINFYSLSAKQFFNSRHNPLHWKVFDVADGAEITLDENHRLWFRDRATQCLNYFNMETNAVVTTNKRITFGIKQITTDEQGRIWIFYWLAGVEIFDPQTGLSVSDFLSKRHRHSALSENAAYLYIDRQKNYWIGSEKGISIYHAKNQFYKLYTLGVGDRGLEMEPVNINAIAQHKADHLWIGTNLGLFSYALTSGEYGEVPLPSNIRAIYSLRAVGDTLWIGTEKNLIALDVNDTKVVHQLPMRPGSYFIQRGQFQDLWLGFWKGGLLHYDPLTGGQDHYAPVPRNENSLKSLNLISGLAHANQFWVGYNAGVGFSHFNLSDHHWYHYQPQTQDNSNSYAGTVTVIRADANDDLWLGTHGAGIIHYDVVRGSYQYYQQEDGINSNFINSILTDQSGHLWISTADGIDYLNAKTKTIRSLDIDLVFPDNDFKANGLQGIAGKLYFFCNAEFVEIESDLFHPDREFLPLVISGFKIFDQEMPQVPAQIRLSHRENFFSFTYSSIGTQPPKDVRYAYMLKGFDRDWNYVGVQQSASYTDVSGGHYVFMVKATNRDGQWNDEVLEIPVYIAPPFWQTWWFLVLCALSLISAAYALHRYRIGQVKKIYSVRTQISRDLHDDIGASLSSINIYSTVAASEVKENPEKAKEILQQININSRQVMENISDIVWANRISQSDDSTLASRIKNYGYDLLSQKNINCQYDIDPHLENKLTSPEARKSILLIIKEALNNIAKYSGASAAEVKVAMNDSYLNVQVTDNGRGFDLQNARAGNGLIHMKQRAEALGGHFAISSVAMSGTRIETEIPIASISDR